MWEERARAFSGRRQGKALSSPGRLRLSAGCAGFALLLASCGSEGGNRAPPISVVDAPGPSPSPSPTPTPPPPPRVGLNNLVEAQQFVTLGFGHLQTAGPFDDILVPGTIAAQNIRLAFSGGRYQADIPGLQPDTLTSSGGASLNGTPYAYNLSGRNGFILTIFDPGSIDPERRLTHSSFGMWVHPVSVDGGPRFRGGTFAYGLPTPPGETPVAGRSAYRAFAFGYVDLGADVAGVVPLAGGQGDLTLDFGAGLIEGAIIPTTYLSVGGTAPFRLELTGASYVPGAASFSGRFRLPDGTVGGAFEGAFTGPEAREMIVRWEAPFADQATGKTGTLYGVWIARRI